MQIINQEIRLFITLPRLLTNQEEWDCYAQTTCTVDSYVEVDEGVRHCFVLNASAAEDALLEWIQKL